MVVFELIKAVILRYRIKNNNLGFLSIILTKNLGIEGSLYPQSLLDAPLIFFVDLLCLKCILLRLA